MGCEDAGRLQRVFVISPLTPASPACRSLALKSPPTVEIRLYSLVLCQNILLECTRLFYNVHAAMSNFLPKDNNFFLQVQAFTEIKNHSLYVT